MENFEYIVRYVLCFLAIAVILNCVLSLIRLRPKKKIYALLVDVTNGDEFPITCYETSIGRSKSCDMAFSNITVSRSHAVVALRKDGFYVFDTESKAGVYVNGERVKGSQKVINGDLIAFGTAILKFYVGSEANDDIMQSEKDPIIRAMLTNVADNTIFQLDGEVVTIGRQKGNNIEISAPYISRRHAQLNLYENRWYIQNFSSVTATTVNNEIVYSPVPLSRGDVIGIGDFKFVYEDCR